MFEEPPHFWALPKRRFGHGLPGTRFPLGSGEAEWCLYELSLINFLISSRAARWMKLDLKWKVSLGTKEMPEYRRITRFQKENSNSCSTDSANRKIRHSMHTAISTTLCEREPTQVIFR